MLQYLLSQRDSSGLVLINDSLQHRARLIVDCLTSTWANRGISVHILSYDREACSVQKCFSTTAASWITIHDAFGSPSKFSPSTWVDCFGQEKEPFTIVIDSLSTVMMNHRFEDVYVGLLCLLRKVKAVQLVLALLHTDVHGEHEVAKLCHLATTTLTPYHLQDTPNAAGCKTVHRKPGGRILRQEEEFILKPDLSIADIKKVDRQKLEAKPAPQQPDPTANLTFNLRLSDEEKATKDSLVLPYIRKQPSGGGKGEITYVMEREDDFDEEDDPDDDLNF